MRDQINLRPLWILVILLSSLFLFGCGAVPALVGVLPFPKPEAETDPEVDLPPVMDPIAARQAALDFVRMNFGSAAPSPDLVWNSINSQTGDVVGSITHDYIANEWSIQVSYPLTRPDAAIYTIQISQADSGFIWEGLVSSNGQVATTVISLGKPTATLEEVQPSPTDDPTQTPTPTETLTPTIPPTSTKEPTPTQVPTLTPTPIPCNVAKFVSDVTVPDGTIYPPNLDFKKVWRLKNVGACSWTTDYDLVFVDGNRMGGRKALELPEKVLPGESVDISLTLTSPSEGGDYRGYWMLRAGDGVIFGLGEDTNKAFWVSITVAVPQRKYDYDFTLNFCGATWRSETGRLSCLKDIDSDDGFVKLLDQPNLENRHENELALWVHPNEKRYGWIEGIYPSIKIENGDHFSAWVGCLEGYEKCSLKFYLDYEDEDGRVRRLGEWLEVYEGQVTQIVLDLSHLAGSSIRFILGVEANTKNVDQAHGFWFVPVINNLDRQGRIQ